jgi:hypothetical protein
MSRREKVLARPVLFVIAALAACQPEGDGVIETVFDPCTPLVLTLEEGATAAQRDSVRAGAALWNEHADARLFVDADLQAEGLPEQTPAVPVRFEAAAPVFLGLYDDVDGEVLINRTLEPARARDLTVAHEVGHAFGLTHVEPEDRRSVMNTGNTTVEPTDADVAELQALWGRCDEGR